MIRHIVLIKFKPDTDEANISTLFYELQNIRRKIPGILSITSGRSESPERIERGYMHGFVVDFDTWESLETYQNDPDHKSLGAKLVAGAEGGKDGILCFDLPTSQA
jgi:Stress responsive A/B Barrel Domain